MATHSEFGEKTSAIEVAKAFADQIKGKTAHLVLASRTDAKMDVISKRIAESFAGVQVSKVQVDLSFPDSIKHAASETKKLLGKLNVIINNAAIFNKDRQLDSRGIEMQFATNHLGIFHLTSLLLPLLRKAAETSRAGAVRVVNVSSAGHFFSPIRFSDLNFAGNNLDSDEKPNLEIPGFVMPEGMISAKGYSAFAAYGQAKTANILMAQYLTSKLKDSGIVSYAVHPGTIATGIGRGFSPEHYQGMLDTAEYVKSIDEGAATMLVAAFDPALNTGKETYLSDCQFAPAMPFATDPVKAEKLWKLSEELVGEKFEL
ncbi:hypothetical protein MMC25_003458 [Agyrium rufum]|nr:hypothetical protein [Agyrium rufum]